MWNSRCAKSWQPGCTLANQSSIAALILSEEGTGMSNRRMLPSIEQMAFQMCSHVFGKWSRIVAGNLLSRGYPDGSHPHGTAQI